MSSSCRLCNSRFVITEGDLRIIEKISPVFRGAVHLIASPTLCPEHRQERRQAWRNERTLYRRSCGLTGEPVVSIYHPDCRFPVYSHSAWWSDQWEATAFGRDISFEQPFFQQYAALQAVVPRIASFAKNAVNSGYCNHVDGAKNCYLCVSVAGEELFYSDWIINSRDVCDSYQLRNCELCYENIYCKGNHRCAFAYFSDDCSDSAFLYHCKSCQNCFQCWNLHRARYCIRNIQHTKAEYEQAMAALCSFSELEQARSSFDELIATQAIRRDQEQINCENSSGDLLSDCRNVHDSYDVIETQDGRYCYNAGHLTDGLDVYESGFTCALQYETHACNRSTSVFAGHVSYDVSDCLYVDSCHNSRNLFGCIGMRNAAYCILNKQYTKEEYDTLVPRLIEHMRSTKEWGEFFPIELSPFGFNETVAQEYFPRTKEDVLKHGWSWREAPGEGPDAGAVVDANELPDSIHSVPDSMIQTAIRCGATGRPFRIIHQELDFYRAMKLPLPRFHPKERHLRRFGRRNPRRLWKRPCMKCAREILTTYSPERREIVYCESCYLNELY